MIAWYWWPRLSLTSFEFMSSKFESEVKGASMAATVQLVGDSEDDQMKKLHYRIDQQCNLIGMLKERVDRTQEEVNQT